MAKSIKRLHKGGRFGRLHSEGPAMIIVEHKLGFVCANAGIDHSNVAGEGTVDEEWVLLLPVSLAGDVVHVLKDPDEALAHRVRERGAQDGLHILLQVLGLGHADHAGSDG